MVPIMPGEILESPSLAPSSDGGGPAYEMKFLLGEGLARSVEDWARSRLAADPHGDEAFGGAYRTTTLYCDTPARDIFLGRPGYRRSKFRLRRYGEEQRAFLERKFRKGDRVRKKRSVVAGLEL